MSAKKRDKELWRARLYAPAFRIQDAARYAEISAQTVARWHNLTGTNRSVLSHKQPREALSYLQLIELAVVASMRGLGVPLEKIRLAREYLATQMRSEYPLAEYEFKTDGKELLVELKDVDPGGAVDSLVAASSKGQLVWKEALRRRLDEFEYETGGIARQWWLRGRNKPVVIDPTIAFGAPNVGTIPTWAVRQHWDAGESIKDIANDFGIKTALVECALEFEGLKPDHSRRDLWAS